MEEKKAQIHHFLNNQYFLQVKYILFFVILLFGFHYLYIFWASNNFFPLAHLVDNLFKHASSLLFNQSVWVLKNLFHINYTAESQTIYVVTKAGNWGYVDVSPGCTSLKQWMHWLFLMLFFPGPWRHKLWYIPFGIIIIHFVNLIRIVGLSLILVPWSEHFNFFHDYIFKTFFYFMIFIMWVSWVEFFLIKRTKSVS
ncbi:MAG: exosortase/archaeosortase family protein [Bacteroidetes bacterium]|nr:exosortase/archaeosortase family protein [Bacteroidota bacterium]